MRDFRFRAWDTVMKSMHEIAGFIQFNEFTEIHFGPSGFKRGQFEIMQYTGFMDKNGRRVFEGDIFRIEEEDMIFYVVVVWVQEWAMFTTLRIEDEYQAYLIEGVDGIDETMFWTYTLEDIDSPKHSPCGNIYQNPELLNSQTVTP